MKVILIKDSVAGKANNVIDVADGYAKNFLIKNKLALPYNEVTKQVHSKNQAQLKAEHERQVAAATRLKSALESVHLVFKLKATGDKVHGSITKKQVLTALAERGITVDPHVFENIHITTLGLSTLPAKLHSEVSAKVKVEVRPDE